MKHFHWYEAVDLQPLIRFREGECKLGEQLVLAKDIISRECQFVLIGIKEDMGVKANLGIGGTDSAWESFLSAFVNIQSIAKLTGKEIQLLGYFDFPDLITPPSVAEYRQAVKHIDEEVVEMIALITCHGKIPIVIGGSHANAYPIIKGASLGYHQAGVMFAPSITCINLDAHADFRQKEGRHSGNSFRYAYGEGYLKKYAIVGLHESYNAQNIITELEHNQDVWFCFWEDIFLRETLSFQGAVRDATEFTKETLTGIELDLDCIENVLSSAMTPSGITATQARWYMHTTATESRVAYLHICEGATQLADGRKNLTTGKLISYLVSDFIKAYRSK